MKKAVFPLNVNDEIFNITVKFAKYREPPQKQRLFITVDDSADKKIEV